MKFVIQAGHQNNTFILKSSEFATWSWYTRWSSEHTGSVQSLSSPQIWGWLLIMNNLSSSSNISEGGRIKSPSSELIELRTTAIISGLQHSNSDIQNGSSLFVSLKTIRHAFWSKGMIIKPIAVDSCKRRIVLSASSCNSSQWSLKQKLEVVI